ncbi:MAG: hypothetical protein AAF928_03760 [Myxococcota bacterium]
MPHRRPWFAVGILGAVTLASACGPTTPAQYPDGAAVASSQRTWCAMLADLDGEKLDAWGYAEPCVAATPAASSAFVAQMTKCYGDTKKGLGDDAPDTAAIIDSCQEDILVNAEPGDVSATRLYQARCSRKERCAEVSRASCDQVWEQLDGRTRSALTSMFNLSAQAEIASCLEDTACSDDEESVLEACYRPRRDALVWLPLNYAADAPPGVTPR